jgi:uncharacterized protein DUF3108
MGSQQFARGRGTDSVRLTSAVALLIALFVCVCRAAEPWSDRIGPQSPGPFPLVRPFSGEFRFGWSEIEAASARAKLSYSEDKIVVEVEGGTDGLARALWQLDATHKAIVLKDGLTPVWFEQVEKYAKKTVRTEAVFKPDGLWRIRAVTPDPKNVPRWKKIKVEPVRDLISAMLLIRSQPLNDGDRIGVVTFPGDAPFLVEVTVAKHERIRIADQFRDAIKLDFQIQRIDLKKKNLTPHRKFRSGSVWLSNDADRIPLRAEVNIFIGYVFGELRSLHFD